MALTIPEGPKMDALVAALEAISEVMEESDAGAALSAARAEQYAIAAGKYGNMSAYAVSVDPGESAAVAKTEEEDGYRLTFSIPRGDQGKGISSIALTNDYKSPARARGSARRNIRVLCRHGCQFYFG